MLLRTAIFAAVAIFLATQVPSLVAPGSGPQSPAIDPHATAKLQDAGAAPGRVKLKADPRGHFNGIFKINGKQVDGLVDTGASFVALNESTARKLGYGANSLDFRYPVSTANGSTDAAHVVLDRVEIGPLRVKNVEALVLRDKALSGALVGMSFLKRLRSFQVEDGNLTLDQ